MYENKPTRVIKPLYMLIKVDVDADIVHNQAKAHTYAQNHCDKLEYELVDYHYPTKYSEREYPFIKLWTNTSNYDYTKLAAPQPQAAQVQGQATHGTSCQEAY